MTNFIQKTHLDIGFSDFNCLLDSQCSLLTSQILGRCIKSKRSNRAYAVYWLCGTLLCPCNHLVSAACESICRVPLTDRVVSTKLDYLQSFVLSPSSLVQDKLMPRGL